MVIPLDDKGIPCRKFLDLRDAGCKWLGYRWSALLLPYNVGKSALPDELVRRIPGLGI